MESEKYTVISEEPKIRMPQRRPYHLLYVLLLELSFCGALLQHGEPFVLLGLMAGALIFAVIPYIPYRYFNDLFRLILSVLIFSGACGWGYWRFQNHCFNDLLLLECLGICSFSFLMEGKPRNSFYLLFISVLYLIYGGIVPRFSYFIVICLALPLSCILLGCTHLEHLAGSRTVFREQKNHHLPELPGILFLLIFTGILVWLIFPLMPLQDNDMRGVFETSFATKKESALPPDLRSWLRPKKNSPSNKKEDPLSEGGNLPPTEVSQKKGTPMDLPDQKNEALLEGSGGSSSTGKELLFYADSPVKLYHLVRLYDAYDGKKWTTSEKMSRIFVGDTRSLTIFFSDVETRYTMLRLISPRLPAPYQLYYISYPEDVFFQYPAVKYTGSGAVLENMNVPKNMRYIASSRIVMKKSNAAYGAKDKTWVERIPKSYFLKLPPKKVISKRVRALAKEITEGKVDPLEKALALRDYLRNHFIYKFYASPLPAGREAADYFLFELKEGHCEYFASALAVLARCAGLPSRVATGFSPGNYNTLTNQFEVYEYHAHAWTQIYIPNSGWLTMDGTPPGSMMDEVFPAGIGKLRDPFGDEWKVMPPELTEQTQNYLKKEMAHLIERRQGLLLDQAIIASVTVGEALHEKIKASKENVGKKIKQEQKKGGKLYRMEELYKKIVRRMKETLWGIYDFFYTAWYLILASLILLIFLLKLCGMICRVLWRKTAQLFLYCQRLRINRLMCRSPGEAVRKIYRTFRFALRVSGFRREKNMELLAFAEMLQSVHWELGEDARCIFLAFYRVEYGEYVPSQADLNLLLAALDRSTVFLRSVVRRNER